MKIEVSIKHKDKIIQNKKLLTDEEINNCVCGVGSVLHRTLSEMKNDVIKNFLNEFTEYDDKQSDATKIKYMHYPKTKI